MSIDNCLLLPDKNGTMTGIAGKEEWKERRKKKKQKDLLPATRHNAQTHQLKKHWEWLKIRCITSMVIQESDLCGPIIYLLLFSVNSRLYNLPAPLLAKNFRSIGLLSLSEHSAQEICLTHGIAIIIQFCAWLKYAFGWHRLVHVLLVLCYCIIIQVPQRIEKFYYHDGFRRHTTKWTLYSSGKAFWAALFHHDDGCSSSIWVVVLITLEHGSSLFTYQMHQLIWYPVL